MSRTVQQYLDSIHHIELDLVITCTSRILCLAVQPIMERHMVWRLGGVLGKHWFTHRQIERTVKLDCLLWGRMSQIKFE